MPASAEERIAGEMPWTAARCLNCAIQASKPLPSWPQLAARATVGRTISHRAKAIAPRHETESLALDTCERIPFPSRLPTARQRHVLEQDRFRLNHLVPTATWRLKRESGSTS